MTLTPVFCTGFEHGVIIASNNGGGLGGVFGGTPAVRNTFPRVGVYACRINPAGGAMNLQFPPGPAMSLSTVSFRFYIRFNSAKPGATCNLAYIPGPTNLPIFQYNFGTDRFQITVSGGTPTQITDIGSPAVNTYYLVEIWADTSTTAYVAKCRVNGGTIFTASFTSASAQAMTRFALGTAGVTTYDCEYDDVIGGSSTVNPEWWGPGRGVLLKPNADGTHNAGTNTIEDNAGADIGAVAAWSIIDDIPLSEATTFIRQAAVGSGNYAEVAFEDANGGVINAVQALLAYSSSGTTANAAETRIRRGSGTPADVLGISATGTGLTSVQKGTVGTAVDMSDSGPIYKATLVPHTTDGTDYGGWSTSEVNALLARVGFATGVATLPRWLNLVLEVDLGPILLGQPSDTETANAIVPRKQKQLGQAIETDTAGTITRLAGGHSVAMAQAVETDTGLAIAHYRQVHPGQAVDTETARTVAAQHRRAMGQAIESDAAQTLTGRHARLAAQALDTEIARAISAQHRRTLAQAVETDTGQTVAARHVRSMAQALEIELAQAFTPRRQRAMAQAIDTETAQHFTAQHRRTMAQVLETELARAISLPGKQNITVNQAFETDTARAITGQRPRAVGQAVEADTARSVQAQRRHVLGQAVETDTAQQIRSGGPMRVTLGQAVEADAAVAMFVQHQLGIAVPVGTATELDFAGWIAPDPLVIKVKARYDPQVNLTALYDTMDELAAWFIPATILLGTSDHDINLRAREDATIEEKARR
jgi:hypothetical protein